MKITRATAGRLAKLSFYASLGPITGPLAAGFVRNLKRGDRILAALYVAAIPSAYFLLSFFSLWSFDALLP